MITDENASRTHVGDVFCDTRTITGEMGRKPGKSELALEGVSEEVQTFVRGTDLIVFMACIMSSKWLRVNIKLVLTTDTIK